MRQGAGNDPDVPDNELAGVAGHVKIPRKLGGRSSRSPQLLARADVDVVHCHHEHVVVQVFSLAAHPSADHAGR